MSSRAQRQATAIWVLADAIADASSDMQPIRVATSRLRGFVLPVFDPKNPIDEPAMRRVFDKIHNFLKDIFENAGPSPLPQEYIFSYLHMLTALVGDQWAQCPDKPPERKRNWRRLNNLIAELINASDPGEDTGVERGCEWAAVVNKILSQC